MQDPRVEQLADVLVNYSVAVRPGDKVRITGDTLAEPLLMAVYAKVLEAGGHPLLIPTFPGEQEVFFRHASDEQLKYVPDVVKRMVQTFDVAIKVRGAANTKSLNNIDPQKMVLARQAQTELTRIHAERAAAGELRWTTTIYPTHAYAQDADMSLSEFADFVYTACMPEQNDPVGYWRRFSTWQQRIVDWFEGKGRVHVVGPGTDLHLSVDNRTFINSNGQHNMPDGEVFTGPVENSVEGHVTFSYPAIYAGREVIGVQLWFERGRVVKAAAEKNQDFLLKTLDTDEGARFVGEFAIGTNKGITRFTRQLLFDEKINGSIHLALGRGYLETGSKNESAIHWDMLCDLRDGGEIWVDDELLLRDGVFVIDF